MDRGVGAMDSSDDSLREVQTLGLPVDLMNHLPRHGLNSLLRVLKYRVQILRIPNVTTMVSSPSLGGSEESM